MTFTKTSAKILQTIFHPIIIPTISLVILFNSNTYFSFININTQFRLYIIVLLLTVFVPFGLIFLIKTFIPEKIKNKLKILNLIRLAVVLITNLLAFFLLKQIGVVIHVFLPIIFLTTAIIALLSLIISFWKEININMVAISALTGFITSLIFIFNVDLIYFLIVSFFVSGLVGYSQLALEKNNQFQIYSSYIFGYFASILILISLKILFYAIFY